MNGKGQQNRLLDVFVFGPIMILGAAMIPDRYPGLRTALAAIGAGTMIYNGANFRAYERLRRARLR